jgi:pimeloyl-ACP methyl ester carboxylesterase
VIAFDRTGDGPPLVLLHPLGADRRVWDPIVDRLSEVRDVIALDIPGFGESPPLEGSVPTPSALAKAIAEQLVAIGVQRPHVAGNSLGGWVALELGLSGYARTVTAIAPAGLWPRPLVPKAGIAQRLARSFLPLIGPVAANPAGRALLLSSAVAHPRRVPRGPPAWSGPMRSRPPSTRSTTRCAPAALRGSSGSAARSRSCGPTAIS